MLKRLLQLSDTIMPLLAMLAYLPVIRKIQGKDKIIPLYLLITFFVMLLSNYMADKFINNSYLYHAYSLIEISLFSFYIRKLTNDSNFLIKLILPLYAIFWILNLFFLESYLQFNSNSSGIAYLLLIVYSLNYFLFLSRSEEIMSFQKSPAFWIVSGFLFYSVLNVLIATIYKYAFELSPSDKNLVFNFSYVSNIIKFILIIIGVLWYPHKYRSG
jgi:membrane-associated HD superfamily phosphohydrolase